MAILGLEGDLQASDSLRPDEDPPLRRVDEIDGFDPGTGDVPSEISGDGRDRTGGVVGRHDSVFFSDCLGKTIEKLLHRAAQFIRGTQKWGNGQCVHTFPALLQ